MSPSRSMTLAREKRIRKRRDFLRVQKYGFRAFGQFVVAIAQRDKENSDGRIGITIPKKVGRAHERNKIKRRIRHVMRLNQLLFYEKALVIVVRDSASKANFLDLQKDILDTCRRIRFHNQHHRKRCAKTFSSGALHEHSV